jgi:LmbE family N-acetylglucosaminyl deacetylase
MEWIYLSPHFDDVAFSCGGLVWQQVQEGFQVSVWTICAGDPPAGNLSPFAASLHERWETGIEAGQVRREEDITANRILGASYHHFSVPDCIYRKSVADVPLYPSVQSLFGQLNPTEENLVNELVHNFDRMAQVNKPKSGLNIVIPLALGNHVDHQLVRRSAEIWGKGQDTLRLWYYADFPYSLHEKDLRKKLEVKGMEEFCFSISPEALRAWFRASAAHASQISTFWRDESELKAVLEDYLAENMGICLWKEI